MIFDFNIFMKKSLLFLLFIYNSVLFSQTVLTSYPLDLSKSEQNIQILNAENIVTHDIFTFMANQQNITILKYNSALFLNYQMTLPLENLQGRSIIGYSFSDDGNPTLYWSSNNSNDIILSKYYLETKSVKSVRFRFPDPNQYVSTSFQQNNLFYLLSKSTTENTLTLYTFQNGIAEEKTYNFSPYKFQSKHFRNTTFTALIKENPIEKMEKDDYNPLYKSTAKNKIYMLKDKLILTLDQHPKQTQVFELNTKNDSVTEKTFPHPIPKKAIRSSNSFYADNKLYQLLSTSDEMIFQVKDYDSNIVLKNITVSKNDTIKFKNSPLLIQREQGKPGKIKKTAKFLSYLTNLDIGLSVFKNKKNTLITFGGTPKDYTMEYMVLSFLDAGEFGLISDDFISSHRPTNYTTLGIHTETVFFETSWNKNFEPDTREPLPLASDKISYFLNKNKQAELDAVIKYKDFYILGYYDSKEKQYIMRKFEDGFIREDNGNPIINKSQFSKPFLFKKP